MANWAIALVRGGQELRFKERGEQRYGLTIYVPLGKYKFIPRRKHSLIIVERPVFRNYAFIANRLGMVPVLQNLPQFFAVLTSEEGEVCMVSQSLVDGLQERERSGEFDDLPQGNVLLLPVGSEVRLQAGPLEGRKGIVIRANYKQNIVVLDVGGKTVKMSLSFGLG